MSTNTSRKKPRKTSSGKLYTYAEYRRLFSDEPAEFVTIESDFEQRFRKQGAAAIRRERASASHCGHK